MKIEKISIDVIKPYENDAKLHPHEQIEQIKKSIQEFGNNDPIAIDENGVIIEGHGRYEALKQLGFDEIEIIRLSHLNEQQKKAYVGTRSWHKIAHVEREGSSIIRKCDKNMAEVKIKCIHCGSEEVVKIGKQRNGTPRCKCKKCQKTFQTEYINKGECPSCRESVFFSEREAKEDS